MIFLDFETRSLADLGEVGGRSYARDPSTELLCATAVDTRTEPATCYAWSPWHKQKGCFIRGWQVAPEDLLKIGFPADAVCYAEPTVDLPGPIERAANDGVDFVAHNAWEFDEHVWVESGYPTANWLDSMARVARRGLPRGLDHVGGQLFEAGKDPLGYRLMLASSLPQTKGPLKGRHIDPDSARLSAITRYCLRDALLVAAVWQDEGLGEPDPDDLVLQAHRAINDRGIRVDIPACLRARAEDQKQQGIAVERATKETGGIATAKFLASPVQVQRWLQDQGLKTPDCTRDTLERLIESGVEGVARTVIQARLAVSGITGGKLEGLITRTCPDGRLRGTTTYYGAHTGRWSGRGVQTQNLQTPKVKVPDDVYDHPDQAPMVAEEEEVSVADVLGSMLRGFFIADEDSEGLGIIDYSSVEARVLLWCAQDFEQLEQYKLDDETKEENERRKSRGEKPLPTSDAYKRLGGRIFSKPALEVSKIERQAGKVGVLACGYQGGPGALLRMAEKARVDLAAAGVSAEQVVEAWRDANPLVAGVASGSWFTPEGKPIVLRRGGIWRDTKQAVEWLARGVSTEEKACQCVWTREGKHFVCTLPSGRRLVYRDVRWEKAKNKFGGESDAITFTSNRGHRTATYGGKLVENVVQAVCRDLLSTAMVQLEEEGIAVVMHVHDELVFKCRKRADYHRAETIIRTNPRWADRLPIFCEGTVSRRYCKP